MRKECGEGFNPEVLTPELITKLRNKAVILDAATPLIDVYCGRMPGERTQTYLDGLTVEERRVLDEWDGFLQVAIEPHERESFFGVLKVSEPALKRYAARIRSHKLYEQRALQEIPPDLDLRPDAIEVTVGDLRRVCGDIRGGELLLQGENVAIIGRIFAPVTTGL